MSNNFRVGGPSPYLYDPGEQIGNFQIVEVTETGKARADNWYRVRYNCCGREEVLNHYVVAKRGGKASSPCKVCRYGPGSETPQQHVIWISEGRMRGPWPTISPLGAR